MLSFTTPIPVDALMDALSEDGFHNRGPVPVIKRAQVVIGRDVNGKGDVPLYGREYLEEIIRSGQPAKILGVCITPNFDSDEFDFACAAMVVLKGSHSQ